MKKAVFVAVFAAASITAAAQQAPLLGIPREQATGLNPAALPLDFSYENYARSAGAAHRQQWLGVEGAPAFSTAFLDLQSHRTRLGGGLRFVSDRTGKLGLQSVGGSVRSVLQVSRARNLWLSAGLGAAAANFQAKLNEIDWRDADDPLAQAPVSSWFADVSAGVFLFKPQSFGLGFSMPSAFELSPSFEVGGQRILERRRHFFAFANCFLPLAGISREAFLEPSVWLRTVGGAPMSADAGLRFLPNRHFWAGAGIGTAVARFETGLFFRQKNGETGRGKLSLAYDFFYRKIRGSAVEAAISWAWR